MVKSPPDRKSRESPPASPEAVLSESGRHGVARGADVQNSCLPAVEIIYLSVRIQGDGCPALMDADRLLKRSLSASNSGSAEILCDV